MKRKPSPSRNTASKKSRPNLEALTSEESSQESVNIQRDNAQTSINHSNRSIDHDDTLTREQNATPTTTSVVRNVYNFKLNNYCIKIIFSIV
jgi:hypothetical protein